MPSDFIEPLGDGVYAIDTDFQRSRFDAAFLVVEGGRAAFIDTGTNHAVPRLLAALDHLGLTPACVDWVIPTHVHLDHAGGVGLLMQALPRAQMLVHPRGLRHMVDPRVLWAGARAVYGDEEMQRSYGRLVPVPAGRAQASHDGQVIDLAGRPLLVLDTPGHARHHHCVWDARTRGWFTGDTFGLSYREFDTEQGPWIVPTSTPVQFEPEVLRSSIERMMSYQPDCMYLTHYSRVRDVPRLAALLLSEIDEMVAMALEQAHPAEGLHQRLKQGMAEIFLRRLQEHGCKLPREQQLDLLALDLELNAQGLEIWLGKLAQAAKAGPQR